ncbi:MAG: ring-cleaving dioxygenase [Acidobacteria bacterium]|nr:ring-cleaving dioxygenase [Acidobacteriota bacterium]
MATHRGVNGLHHITAIAGPAQENLDFYAGVLGMRLVKKSVNQDDPGTLHLFYADAEGAPGTDLTFFPWAHDAPPRRGHGLTAEVGLEVPFGSLEYWAGRLDRYGVTYSAAETRFGQRVLPLVDPHGLEVALVEAGADDRPWSTPWDASPVPAERQIRGLHGARVWERDAAPTEQFLTDVMGFERVAADDGWVRFGFTQAHGVIDVRETPGERRGAWGVGAVHHLAWRVDDDEHQVAMRQRVEANGRHPTPVIDRFWFKSVYFLEPGGVLFEMATDGPGFAVDEDPAHLGEALILPPFLESRRPEIERVVPALTPPSRAARVIRS